MRSLGSFLERAGGLFAIVGAAGLALIFAVVIVNGSWPAFLAPVRELFSALGNTIGGAALVVEGLMFIGPGLALQAIGRKLQHRQKERHEVNS